MGSDVPHEKPHVVCVPYPAQGHINPMMSLAKLLHSRGFHVTFALTDYERARLLRSRGPHALDGLPSFRFASFPDGLPPSVDAGSVQEVPTLFDTLHRCGGGPFTELLRGLGQGGGPRVCCVVVDLCMAFALEAAEALGIKGVVFWAAGGCALLGLDQFPRLLREGYAPLKDSSCLTNGYLDTPLDWMTSMKGIRLKDIPTFNRTTDPNDTMVRTLTSMVEKSRKASALIINTFDALEHDILASLAPDFPPLYPVGPLHILLNNHDNRNDKVIDSIGSNLWREDQSCITWLDSKEPGSVLYVNFGSMAVLTNVQLLEFAFGLANSGKQFLWVIRPNLVSGDTILPPEFIEATKERSIIADWCDQERVLSHVAIGGFLTHSGWNSTIESVGSGVPVISWPFFADQQTNCWVCCNKWKIGMEIDSDVKRENVEMQVRELMDGEKGKEMRRKTMELKVLAEKAVTKGSGKSWKTFEKLITQVLESS